MRLHIYQISFSLFVLGCSYLVIDIRFGAEIYQICLDVLLIPCSMVTFFMGYKNKQINPILFTTTLIVMMERLYYSHSLITFVYGLILANQLLCYQTQSEHINQIMTLVILPQFCIKFWNNSQLEDSVVISIIAFNWLLSVIVKGVAWLRNWRSSNQQFQKTQITALKDRSFLQGNIKIQEGLENKLEQEQILPNWTSSFNQDSKFELYGQIPLPIAILDLNFQVIYRNKSFKNCIFDINQSNMSEIEIKEILKKFNYYLIFSRCTAAHMRPNIIVGSINNLEQSENLQNQRNKSESFQRRMRSSKKQDDSEPMTAIIEELMTNTDAKLIKREYQFTNRFGKQKTYQWKFQLFAGQNKVNQFLVTIHDISQKVVRKTQQYKHIKGSQQLGSFSHELRTPLNCSLQLLELLLEKTHDKDIVVNYILPALNSNRLLLHQINDILDYASFESNCFQLNSKTFKIAELVNQCSEIYEVACRQKNLKFKVELDVMIDKIFNDQSRIMQVLVTLLNNCIKFTKNNGQILLKITQQAQYIYEIKVSDNGFGISPSRLNMIRHSLSMTDDQIILTESEKETMHTGLGLKIGNQIIKHLIDSYLRNTFKIVSQENEFTIVSFFIQNFANDQNSMNTSFIQQESLDPVETKLKQISIKQPKFNKKFCSCQQVLIVDDVPFNHYALDKMLGSFYQRSISAYDGNQAVEMVKQKFQKDSCCKTFLMILMDIEMPIKNGLLATKEVYKKLQIFLIRQKISSKAKHLKWIFQQLSAQPITIKTRQKKQFHQERTVSQINLQEDKNSSKYQWNNNFYEYLHIFYLIKPEILAGCRL